VLTQQEGDLVDLPREPITRVFDTRHADVRKVGEVLEQLKSPNGTLFVLPDQRRIVATDLVANIEEMVETVRELDTEALSGETAADTDAGDPGRAENSPEPGDQPDTVESATAEPSPDTDPWKDLNFGWTDEGEAEPDSGDGPARVIYYGPEHLGESPDPGRQQEFVTRVFELKHVSVQDVAPLITAWRRPEGTVGQSSFPPGKIVITDTAERIGEFARLLAEIDQPTRSESQDRALEDSGAESDVVPSATP